MSVRAIDAFVNVNMGSLPRADYMVRVAEDYFKRAAETFRDTSIEELTDMMDRCGIEKAILSTIVGFDDNKALAFAEKDPDRFLLSALVDPRDGMTGVRGLEAMVKNHNVVLARVTPFMIGLPPDDRCYYPVYAKCIELDLAISVNTGLPGPPMPGKCQDPIYLDEVCLFFPELKLIMAHGADPWWGVAMRLMLKYRNLYLMTSAYAPRYLPPDFVHFMNTRGKNKVMFASDHPVLSMQRCLEEAQALDLREGVLSKFLYENAARLFVPGAGAESAAGG